MAGRKNRGRNAGSQGGFGGLERLEERKLLSVAASFDEAFGILSVTGDAQDDIISISRSHAGVILVNGGTVPITGGLPTIGSTFLIQAFGFGGSDQIALDETNGALPAAHLDGGNGDDLLTGGSGQDILTGGGGDDQIFGLAGNDRMVWNPGDGTDLLEGGDGADTIQVNGADGAEQFTTTANGLRVRFDRLDPAPFSLDIGTAENLVLDMNGGDDSHSATGNLAALIRIIVDGGEGNDTILGSNGIDLLLGGAGHDFVDGQQGNDVVFLGSGDDVSQWDPGDGSDLIEGQEGADTLRFNGSNGAEIFEVSANGQRVRFTRNLGTIVMDLNGVDAIDLNTLGSADTVTVNDVSGTGLTQIEIDLAAFGGVGDAQIDSVIINGTSGGDILDVSGVGTTAFVSGLPAAIVINGIEADNDSLAINLLGGNDAVSAAALASGVVKLTIDGGLDNDTLIGSRGADLLLGGEGNDLLEGGQGNDLALMGADGDTFVWNPGDGHDFVDGEAGLDTGIFNGSEQGDELAIFVTLFGVRVESNLEVAGFDLIGVESTDVNGLGGNDVIVASPGLSGWTVLDLDGGEGADFLVGGDGGDILRGGAGDDTVSGDAGDDVIVWTVGDGSDRIDGGAGSDRLDFEGSAARDIVTVRAVGARTKIARTDFKPVLLDVGGTETLNFDLKAGDDRITFFDLSGDSAVQSSFVEGGDGRDSILAADVRFDFSASGGAGNDYIVGGAGNDDLQGGSGGDIIVGGTGHDLLDGGEGNDRLHGGAGDDDLRGGIGSDVIFGDQGNDMLDGGNGIDTLDGGEGFDLSINGEIIVNLP